MTDWPLLRTQFPVTENSVYLNTAAAGPLAIQTTQAATEYYNKMMRDGDVHWDDWLAKRETVRAEVAAFINAEPDEIGFTTNTSSGMNLIVDALENHGEVISSELEFPVSTIPWMHRRIPVHPIKSIAGEIPIESVRDAMNVRTGVISLSYVQFSNGFKVDLEALGNIKGNHALVVNASQAAGVFEIDVKRMKIDALCATGHKWMRSGYGSGFVFLSRDLQSRSNGRSIGWLSVQEPYAMKNDEIHLRRDMSARAELGCPHFPGIFAIGASVQMMREVGVNNIQNRVLQLNRRLTAQLSETGWEVLSPLRNEASRSAETLVKAESPQQLVSALASQRILVTEKPQGIRIATDFFNNEDDVDRLVTVLKGSLF
jgi:selenocysteine lyase/cysteine desulfurase